MTLPEILKEFDEKFLNPDPTDSSQQFNPELQGRLPEAFKALLIQTYAAGLEKAFLYMVDSKVKELTTTK